MDTRSLRVHRAQDMIDGSVLAGGIQRLQADQKGALVFQRREDIAVRAVSYRVSQRCFAADFFSVCSAV